MQMIGNMVPDDQGIPISNDEEKDNKVMWTWGEFKTNDDNTFKKHHELLWMIGGFEPQRGRYGGLNKYRNSLSYRDYRPLRLRHV